MLESDGKFTYKFFCYVRKNGTVRIVNLGSLRSDLDAVELQKDETVCAAVRGRIAEKVVHADADSVWVRRGKEDPERFFV